MLVIASVTVVLALLVLYLVTKLSSGKTSGKKKVVSAHGNKLQPYKCLYRRQLTDDVFQFRFEGTLGGDVGVHMHVQGYYPHEETGKETSIIRPYTPTTWHKQQGFFDLVLKRYPKGKASPWICDAKNIDVGKEVMMKVHKSRLKYKNNQWKHIVLFGAGTGITPLYQVALHVKHCEEENTKLTLVYQSRFEHSILLESGINSMRDEGTWNVHHILSRPKESWTGLKGRLSCDQVKTILEEHKLTAEMSQKDEIKCMICGPLAFNKSVKGHLKALGFARAFVF